MWVNSVGLLVYAGAPPTVKIFPPTASYMMALPHILSGSVERLPAALWDPVPEVPYQFMATAGPA